MTVITQTPMKLSHFHDFYYLQALQAAIMTEIARDPQQQFRRSVEKLQLDLQETCDDIIPNMAKRVFVYLYAACLGESRHARSATVRERFVAETLKASRNDCFKSVTEYAPIRENLNALVTIFSQTWRSGYGGPAWKQIADALVSYGKIPDAAWLDHVVDLEHNNGTAFNKVDALDTVHFHTDYPHRFRSFLDYKFSQDLLRTPMHDKYDDTVTLNVSGKVFKLIARWATIFGYKMPWWIRNRLDTLRDYNVIWGGKRISVQEKWTDWVDVTSGNVPNVSTLFDLTGAGETNPYGLTEQEFLKHVKSVIKKSKKIGGKFLTKEVANEFKKYVMDWYEDSRKHCKAQKAKKTYEVLPVEIMKIAGDKFRIFIPLPYQGIGTQVDGGFTFDVVLSSYFPTGHGHIELKYNTLYFYCGTTITDLSNKELEALLD